MKKWIKITVIVFALLLLIILGVLVYSVERINTTPFFETEYYKNTTDRLNQTLEARNTVTGELSAGFASVNITPEIAQGNQVPEAGKFNSLKLAGFGDGQMATGVHDSLFAKAVAMEVNDEKAILVSADLLLIPPDVIDVVTTKLAEHGISRKQLYFGATHTHSGFGNCIPGFVGKQFEGDYQPEVVEWLSKKITDVVLRSVDDLKPAKIANGSISAPAYVANRIIGETGRLNDKLSVISIKQQEGKHAVIGIFAAHPTILGSWNDQLSGDYPGYFQRTLESNGIDIAMFFGGTLGSHTNRGIGSKFEKAEFVGRSLADSALVVLAKMEYTDSVLFSGISTEIEIPKLQIIYITDNLRLSPQVGKKLMYETDSPLLQGFRLNNFIWLTQPCEFSGELSIDLKNALEVKGYNSAITSLNGQYLGYVVPSKYYYFNTYEARLMGWYGPWMGNYLMELNYTIANNLTGVKL
ncbi:MAG: neutral/alkaline non-lysosomal ceramidase N-terminal domain-containing protein [Bacteroidota bacterium]